MLRRKHVTEQGGLLRRDTITQAERRKQNLGKRSKMDGALPAIEAVDGCRSMARRDVARRSRQTSTCASTPTPRLETSRKIHLRSRLKNSILTAATPSSATVSDFSNRGGLFLVGRGARYAAPVNFGAPDTIRTCGLRLRRATLYPAELRGASAAYAVLTRISCECEATSSALASLCIPDLFRAPFLHQLA